MQPNDYAAILGSVAALIIAIGGLAVWQGRKEGPAEKPDERGKRIEDMVHRVEGKLDILLDRVQR